MLPLEREREAELKGVDMSMSSIAGKYLDFDVVKDLQRNCDAACLEPLDIFKHTWKYRGEGNANVVLALQDEQRVIRLSKVNVGEPIGDVAKHRRKVEREVIFANKVFGPLIGPEFVGSVKAIQLDGDQISRLNEMLQSIRPAHRLHKELRVPFATSHGDFARTKLSDKGPDFCVEIKPKQGWWPSSMRNFGESGSSLCTFCMNQFLKLKRSKIASRTWYCPFDLFSGNPQRMIEAITSLIANPQNNFRIFCNGKLVFGEYNDGSLETVLSQWMGSPDNATSIYGSEMPSALNSFIYLLCVSLLKPKYIPEKSVYPTNMDTFTVISRQLRKILVHTPPSELFAKIRAKSRNNGKEHLSYNPNEMCKDGFGSSCNREGPPLPDGCILSRILEIQKLADRQKLAERKEPSIYKIYQKICPVHSFVGQSGKRKPSQIILSPEDYTFSPSRSPPKLNVILAEDDSDDNNVDSGTETERLSDSESFEECCDTSSTEEDEDNTVTGVITLDSPRRGSDPLQEDIIPKVECPSSDCLSVEKWLDEINHLTLSDEEVMLTEMYLLAATAKDCSIMVTFSPTNNSNDNMITSTQEGIGGRDLQNTDLHIEDLRERVHRVRIGVADLDPKPITTIVRHYVRDSEMLQAYNSSFNKTNLG